ncbi:MAG TPA: DUF3800 domain-containing protein [Xanthobacteraceae bacterium]|jgi:hypothetical protein|nr:DUF3800 domain-containing protein [Xanthobacteraceae bacterium]
MLKPSEADLLEQIYIDETSQTGHRFLVIGGITMPKYLSTAFDAYMMKARAQTRLRAHLNDQMELSEIGWNEVSKSEFDAYKTVMQAYFDFAQPHLRSSLTGFEFHCSVVDTHVRGRKYSGKRGEIGFNREIYFHCMTIGRRHKGNLFEVHPDQRQTEQSMDEMRKILNYGIRREFAGRPAPFRRVQFRKSHDVQALQISDIMIGAVAYRLNGHHDKGGGDDKKQLCEFILKRSGLWNQVVSGRATEKAFSKFQIWVRKHKE